MRILVCAAEPPIEPLNGFRLQLERLGSGLSRAHDVTVLALAREDEPIMPPSWGELVPVPAARTGLRENLGPALAALAGRRPRAVSRATPPMAAALEDLTARREFDVAQVSGPWLAGLAGLLPAPAVLSSLDAWHLNLEAEASLASPLRRRAYRREQRNIHRFIAREFHRYERVVVVSEPDGEALRELDPGLRIEVVPNGVDADAMSPSPGVEREAGLVVFTGAMQWAPNVEAARFLATEVMPRIRARHPEARLAIVGRNPRPEVSELERIEGVTVTGEVPDIRPWLWRASAYVCPMVSGTGIKNKLLEALACGVPCVATSLSLQGIAVEPGADLLVADSAEGLADALARVLADPDLGAQLAERGRRAVVAGHGWDAVVRAHERIYQQALASAAL